MSFKTGTEIFPGESLKHRFFNDRNRFHHGLLFEYLYIWNILVWTFPEQRPCKQKSVILIPHDHETPEDPFTISISRASGNFGKWSAFQDYRKLATG